MSNRIIRNLPDSKYKAVVGNTLAGGSNPFGTESEITDVIETTIEVNGLTSGIQGTSADVVTKLLGSDWRLPTLAEYQELIECCTVGLTQQGGFDIPIVTSNTTHNVLRFLCYNNNYHGSTRLTSNVDSVDITKAATFYANSENLTAYTATIDRYRKVAIRPVTDNPNLGVDMGCPSGVRWASRDLGATTDWNTGNQYAFGEITTKAEYTWDTYLCAQAECGTTEDPLSHVTKPITSTVLHKDNTVAHLNPVKEARWEGKQDALGFIPENVANKITDMSNPIAGQYADAQTIKTFVADAVAGINDFISSGLEMMTAFESCSSLAYGPTKLEVGPWYKNGVSETTNINKGDWAIVLADETVCWFTDGVFKYQRFKDGSLSPFGFVVLSSGTAVAGTKGVNACIEIGEGGVVMSYIYTEVVGENTYICFLDNSANTVVWKVQSLSNTIGAVHKYINSVEQEDVYDLNLPTTRYICSGLNGDIPIWALLYIVNDQPLTQAQWNAINSTITKAWKDQADIDIADLLLHIADGTIHPTAEKQLEWDGKEDGVVRLAEDGGYSSGYAEISGFNTEGSYAIIITSSAYGHVQDSGIIFYSKGFLPKAVGYCPAKYNGGTKKIFISSAGYSKKRMVVLDLDKTYPFAGTITHVEGSYDSVAGQEIENVGSAYEKIANRTNSINSNSTSEEYPSAKAVYDFTKIKSKNFTGSNSSTDIKFAFIPFNANALFSFQRESGAFGEGLMYIRTNNTTVERVVCDSSFRTYDTYFYETSGGVVLCYNVDAEPYNITISTIYDSSGECVLGTTKSLGTQINVDLVKMQGSLTSDSTINISNNVISAVGCKEVIRDTNPISRDLQPNIFTNCKLTVSSWNPICQNHITGIECEYKGRFIADTTFTVGGTDWEGNAITWSGDKDCIASGVYEFSIIDNYGLIKKMN